MVASPLAATVVAAILRCDFCATSWERKKHIKKKHTNKIFTGLSREGGNRDLVIVL